MSQIPLYPMKLAPIYKEKIWGGRKMAKVLNKDLPPELPIGESWELSDYRNDITRVMNGPLTGASLHDLYLGRTQELVGSGSTDEVFPLLTKFIDSNELLSFQVHPSDDYSHIHENGEHGKTECWYIVHAELGAGVIRGLQPGTEPEKLRRAMETSEGLEEMVRRYEVRAGDFIFMPTGMVHAICAGLIVLEVEQNSDMTYRLNDWGRVGADGVPRPLHIEKGMDVINFADDSPDTIEGLPRHEAGNRIVHMCSCKYFSVEILELKSTHREDTGGSHFVCLTVVEGSAEVKGEGGESVNLITGDTVLLPARPQNSTVFPARGGCKMVKAYVDPTHRTFMEPLIRLGFPMDQIEKHIFR